ncbi:MAG: ATP-binding protein [Tannerella sp.]|nr:ATP-binding protein [Tannerella sp.]
MDTKTVKQVPYGISDFRRIITKNYAYVDKTRFIAELEREANPNHFFIRPRKFGKSLFFKMLNYYYNINYKNEMDISLRIPNYSVKTLYWEYIAKRITETSPEITIEERPLKEAIEALAFEGDVHRFIGYVSENAFGKLSDHDLQHFDEKYIRILLLAYLFMNKMYIPMSEYETVPGRADIFLQRNPLLPQVRYEWVLEIKYCKVSATDSEIAAKRNKGLEQLKQYVHSHRMEGRSDLKAALLVFTGKNKFEIIDYKR